MPIRRQLSARQKQELNAETDAQAAKVAEKSAPCKDCAGKKQQSASQKRYKEVDQ